MAEAERRGDLWSPLQRTGPIWGYEAPQNQKVLWGKEGQGSGADGGHTGRRSRSGLCPDAVGATCGRPPVGFPNLRGLAGVRSSPLRDVCRRCVCRGDLRSPAGGFPKFAGFGGRALLAPTGCLSTARLSGRPAVPRRWVFQICGVWRASAARPYGMSVDGASVGATCGRPPVSFPDLRGLSGVRSTPLRDVCRRRVCRGDLWSPAGGFSRFAGFGGQAQLAPTGCLSSARL